MSEDQLYELASRRVDKRTRRWILWGIDLGGWFLSLALVVLSGTPPSAAAVALSMLWLGVFVTHTIVLGLTSSRDRKIEREVARLRSEIYDEKPKRLELGEDGELVESDESESVYAQRHKDSV